MNTSVLVDTDVASYLFKNISHAARFRRFLEGIRPAIAFVSVAELYKWAIKRRWGTKKIDQLESALRHYIVIPYDRDLTWSWARLVATCEDAGRPIAPSDAWVAAAALRHGIPLVTNNQRHYEPAEALCGLKLVRP